MSKFYTSPASMEPMLPREESPELQELAVNLIRDSAALSQRLHPRTRRTIARLLRVMNSYYSNLIEGHATHPVDIEKALKKQFSKDSSKRVLQIESVAHIQVQELLEKRLEKNPSLEICSFEFLGWIHYEFYKRLPPPLLLVKTEDKKRHKIVPGKIRELPVEVGDHLAPEHKTLSKFLTRFQDAYGEEASLSPIRKILALGASHHRLAWIHPFLDGNGRVTRLFSHAFLIKCGLGGGGLWNLSRGLARNRDEYMGALAAADEHRHGDLDGRGNLSLKNLEKFCSFILKTSLDQVHFMAKLLDLDNLLSRMTKYVELESTRGNLPKESIYLVTEAFTKGSLARGEAARLTGLSERSARNVISRLLKLGLLQSDSPKGELYFGCPPSAVPYYFPLLYPESLEVDSRGPKNILGDDLDDLTEGQYADEIAKLEAGFWDDDE